MVFGIGTAKCGIVGLADFIPYEEATTSKQRMKLDVMKKKLKKGFQPDKGTEEARLAQIVKELDKLSQLSRETRQSTLPLTNYQVSVDSDMNGGMTIATQTHNGVVLFAIDKEDTNGLGSREVATLENQIRNQPARVALLDDERVRDGPVPSTKTGQNVRGQSGSVRRRITHEPSMETLITRKDASKDGDAQHERARCERRRMRNCLAKMFKQNEKKMVPILEALHAIHGKTDLGEISRLLLALDGYIGQMYWRFIELHKIPSSLKPVKKLYKSKEMDLTVIRVLMEKLWTHFYADKRENPYEFNPKFLLDASYLPKSEIQTLLGDGAGKLVEKNSKKTAHKSVARNRNAEAGKRHSNSQRNASPKAKKPRLSNATFQSTISVGKDISESANTRVEASLMVVENNYGKPEAERDMRVWLDCQRLPQSTADILLKNGARCIDDVLQLIRACPEFLEGLPTLDRMKLDKAVATSFSAIKLE